MFFFFPQWMERGQEVYIHISKHSFRCIFKAKIIRAAQAAMFRMYKHPLQTATCRSECLCSAKSVESDRHERYIIQEPAIIIDIFYTPSEIR